MSTQLAIEVPTAGCWAWVQEAGVHRRVVVDHRYVPPVHTLQIPSMYTGTIPYRRPLVVADTFCDGITSVGILLRLQGVT